MQGMALFLCIVVGLLWAVSGMIFSKISRSSANMVGFMYITTVFSLLLSVLGVQWNTISLQALPIPRTIVGLMILAGVLNAVYQQSLLAAMRTGHNAIAWTIAQSAMVAPFFCGVLIWHDNPSLLRMMGMAGLIASILILGASRMTGTSLGSPRSWAPLVFGMFLSVGISQTLFTLPSRWLGWSDTGHLRLPFAFAGALLLNGGIAIGSRATLNVRTAAHGLLSALFVFLAQKTLFYAMDRLAATGIVGIAYPLAAGSCIIGFALFSLCIIREQFQRIEVLGMAIGLVGIACML